MRKSGGNHKKLKNVLHHRGEYALRGPDHHHSPFITTIMSNKAAAEAKAKGNAFFLKKQYPEAIEWYTKAIKADPNDSTFYSNRCAAYMGLDKFNEALGDAEMCIKLQPAWVKVPPLIAFFNGNFGINAKKNPIWFLSLGMVPQGCCPDVS